MDKNKKNKKGIANVITFVGICLIICGIATGLVNIDENWSRAFFCCLTGTIMTFIGNYMTNGYIKFFN